MNEAETRADHIAPALAAAGWDKVFMLKDDAEYRSPDFPNRSNIENRINLIADLAKPEDMIFLFFSGHGVSDGGDSIFLPVDASLTRLKDTGIRLNDLVGDFNSRGIRKVILAVDACREQISTTKGLQIAGVGGGSAGNGASLTLYATKAGWYSYEDKDGRNGVFTRFLLQGLGGEADGAGPAGKRDGLISFAELAAWLPDAMGSYALDQGIRQKAVVLKGTGDSAALDIPASKASGVPEEKRAASTPTAVTTPSTQAVLLTAAEIGKLSQGQRLKQSRDFIAKALAYAAQGKVKEVVSALNTAELLDPDIKDDPTTGNDVVNKLGDSFESMMDRKTIDPADLLDIINTVLPRFPQSSRLYYCIGRLYNPDGLNKPKKALEYYNKAIDLDPANVMAHNNRAYIFFAAGQDLDQALKDIKFAIKAYDNDAYSRNMGAKISLKLGDYPQALDIAQSGLRVFDQYRSHYNSDPYIQPELLVDASRALVQLGRNDEAKALLAKAKALGSQEAAGMQMENPALR